MVQRLTEQIEVSRNPKKKSKLVALIDEDSCTGCEVCIEFCPADCIVVTKNPSPELANTVCRVVEEACTGCVLCVRECPWDCMVMVPRDGVEM